MMIRAGMGALGVLDAKETEKEEGNRIDAGLLVAASPSVHLCNFAPRLFRNAYICHRHSLPYI